jgi:hypothetical protein
MADVHRAGGIGGNVFDVHFGALPDSRIAIGDTGPKRILEPLLPKPIGKAQIDKTRSSHFSRSHVRVFGKDSSKLLANNTRRFARRLGQDQGSVRGDISMRRIPWRLDRNRIGGDIPWQYARGDEIAHRRQYSGTEIGK